MKFGDRPNVKGIAMNDVLMRRIKQCPTLPSLPRVAIEVLKMAEDPKIALPEMARMISQDAALVAKTLRTVNSSFYGLSHTISGVDHALVVLGLDGIKTIVLGFSLVQNLKRAKPKGGFDHLAYWRRSIYAATAARVFAEQFGVAMVEEAFLAALLMDIGMLALDQVLGKEYAEITERAPSHAGLAPLEMAKLGMTHAEVAGALAEHWKLPEVLTIPIANHHKPQSMDDSAVKEVAQVVWLAGRCADVFVDAQPEWSLCDVRRTCMERYKIGELDCDAILCRIGLKTNQLAPLFEVPMDPANSYDAILQRANEGLAKVTKALEVEAGPADKRRAPRFARGGMLPIFPYVGGEVGDVERAQFRDASAQGVGIVVSRALPVGSQFIIRLPQKNGEPLPILYTVVRCERHGESEFRVGSELTCVLRQHEIVDRKLVDEREAGLECIRKAILASA
jgi:two-component system cell cycle response regulator